MIQTTYLVVHKVSYNYIKHIADYISIQIHKNTCGTFQTIISQNIDQHEFDVNSVVFIIGDPFKSFTRRVSVKYIFINFSVVAILGNPFNFSFSAYKTIIKKSNLLRSKLSNFDHVLDYWPEQTIALKKKYNEYNIPVSCFPVGINVFPNSPSFRERKYDICFVGALTPRRNKILETLRKNGFILSPAEGMHLEDAAIQSKIVINIHGHRSNHLEIPRILGAMATKSLVLTEHSYGMDYFFPANCYVSCRYQDLSDRVSYLLNKIDESELIAKNAYQWIEKHHSPQCDVAWSELLTSLAK